MNLTKSGTAVYFQVARSWMILWGKSICEEVSVAPYCVSPHMFLVYLKVWNCYDGGRTYLRQQMPGSVSCGWGNLSPSLCASPQLQSLAHTKRPQDFPNACWLEWWDSWEPSQLASVLHITLWLWDQPVSISVMILLLSIEKIIYESHWHRGESKVAISGWGIDNSQNYNWSP